MAYHLLTYSLIFLPVVIALYQLCPARFRFVVLLAADYTFFCMISGKLLVWLLLATLVTYGTGRWLAAIPVRHSDLHGKALTRKKRGVLALGIVLILGALVTLKYLRVFGVTLAAPIGISYYSLQAISYMTDVYRGTQESCKNPIKVALYLSFFPQIMEGPISRFSETADALYGGNSIQFENLVFGYQRIIWGLFKKMVIADRLAPLVAKVFSNYNNFDGAAILVGVLAYTMQLYMEFSGCMDIIMGSGEIFGVPLPENFRQPFFAKNAGDFWRRWHITLGAWLKDYVFYPISLAKPVSKKALANDIPVVLGNDVGCPWITQYDFWRELYYFHKYAGASNAFALYTATARSAELAGIGDITGSIEKGKAADLIVTAKNPLDDLRALRNVDMVVARGTIIDHPKIKKKKQVEAELDKFL